MKRIKNWLKDQVRQTLANFLQDFDLYMDPFYKEQE